MLPLNDTEPNRYSRFPTVTVLLIFINCLIFFTEKYFVSEAYWAFLTKYATTPCLVMSGHGGGALSNVTTMFLHADLSHLVFNMLPLWVFGRRVEDACGPWRFLAFYLLTGTWANILSILVLSDSCVPCIGASGAIFGLIGAYLILYPSGRIRTLIVLLFVPILPRIRGVWVALYFVGVQIIPAINVLLKGQDYRVNYWAHLGGFFSAIFILLFLRPAAFARYLSDTAV